MGSDIVSFVSLCVAVAVAFGTLDQFIITALPVAPLHLDAAPDPVRERRLRHHAFNPSTTWQNLTLFIPMSINDGYNQLCDPFSPGFHFHNFRDLKDQIRTYRLISIVGAIKMSWVIFKCCLPFIFPARLPVSDVEKWTLHGEAGNPTVAPKSQSPDFPEMLVNDAGCAVKPMKKPGLRSLFSCGRKVCSTKTSFTGWCGRDVNGDERCVLCSSCQRFSTSMYQKLKTEPQQLSAALGSVSAPFYDPNDMHKDARLDEIMPRSQNFDHKKALWYFGLRLLEPATVLGFNYPWSKRMQLALFFGQLLQGSFEMVRRFIWGPPPFWYFWSNEWSASIY